MYYKSSTQDFHPNINLNMRELILWMVHRGYIFGFLFIEFGFILITAKQSVLGGMELA